MTAGRCAAHPDRATDILCARCGDYACDACTHRLTPTARPLCAACWRARERVAGEMEHREGIQRSWRIVAVLVAVTVWIAVVVGSILLAG